MATLTGLEAPVKIPTGINGFDAITMGGLTQGRTTLVVGTSGSGKTLFGVEAVYRGIVDFDRTAVFVTFEESAEDIVRNVKKLGWDLGRFVKEGKLRFVDASPDAGYVQETGSYDLSGLLTQIRYTVEEIGASLVVMDSLGSLFMEFPNAPLIRQEILRITDTLKGLGATSILTAERLEEYGPISRHGIEEFAADNVVILRNVLEGEKCRRTIQVLKMRGNIHSKGEYPFTIDETGITVFPITSMVSTDGLDSSTRGQRNSFGNDELDKMTGGGLFKDSITLVSGPTGGGKTLLCSTFAEEACSQGEKALLFTYEESKEQLLHNAEGWGFRFKKWEQEGLLKIVSQYPEIMGLEDHLLTIQRSVEEFKPDRLAIDTITSLQRVSNTRNFHEFLIALTSYLKDQRVCAMFGSTTQKLTGGDAITEGHLSTITDAIILLRYAEVNGLVRRAIATLKMRGSQHEKRVREYFIDSEGLHIGDPFKNVQNILLGVPFSSGPSENEQLSEMFEN